MWPIVSEHCVKVSRCDMPGCLYIAAGGIADTFGAARFIVQKFRLGFFGAMTLDDIPTRHRVAETPTPDEGARANE